MSCGESFDASASATVDGEGGEVAWEGETFEIHERDAEGELTVSVYWDGGSVGDESDDVHVGDVGVALTRLRAGLLSDEWRPLRGGDERAGAGGEVRLMLAVERARRSARAAAAAAQREAAEAEAVREEAESKAAAAAAAAQAEAAEEVEREREALAAAIGREAIRAATGLRVKLKAAKKSSTSFRLVARRVMTGLTSFTLGSAAAAIESDEDDDEDEAAAGAAVGEEDSDDSSDDSSEDGDAAGASDDEALQLRLDAIMGGRSRRASHAAPSDMDEAFGDAQVGPDDGRVARLGRLEVVVMRVRALGEGSAARWPHFRATLSASGAEDASTPAVAAAAAPEQWQEHTLAIEVSEGVEEVHLAIVGSSDASDSGRRRAASLGAARATGGGAVLVGTARLAVSEDLREAQDGWFALGAGSEGGATGPAVRVWRRLVLSADELIAAAAAGDAERVAALCVGEGVAPDSKVPSGEDDRTALWFAAARGGAGGGTAGDVANYDEVTELLLGLGANAALAGTDERGRTCLHAASACGAPAALIAALAEAGADVDAADAEGLAPLHEASISGKMTAVEALLSAGADVGATISASGDGGALRGATALHLAARRGDGGVAKALLAAGAPAGAQTAAGETAVALSARKGHCDIAALLAKGLVDEVVAAGGNSAAWHGAAELLAEAAAQAALLGHEDAAKAVMQSETEARTRAGALSPSAPPVLAEPAVVPPPVAAASLEAQPEAPTDAPPPPFGVSFAVPDVAPVLVPAAPPAAIEMPPQSAHIAPSERPAASAEAPQMETELPPASETPAVEPLAAAATVFAAPPPVSAVAESTITVEGTSAIGAAANTAADAPHAAAPPALSDEDSLEWWESALKPSPPKALPSGGKRKGRRARRHR